MKRIFFLLIVTGLLAACAQQNSPAKNNTADSSLENTRWKLVALTSMSNLPTLSRDVFLQLDSNKIKGFAGCNSYFGSYTKNNTSLQFTGVGSTKMFCNDGMNVETNLFQAFTDTDNYHITGTKLELLKGKDVLASFEALYLQ